MNNTNDQIKHLTANDGKPPVGSSASLLDWNEKVKKAKKNYDIAYAKWVNSHEYKELIEEMKRLGTIR